MADDVIGFMDGLSFILNCLLKRWRIVPCIMGIPAIPWLPMFSPMVLMVQCFSAAFILLGVFMIDQLMLTCSCCLLFAIELAATRFVLIGASLGLETLMGYLLDQRVRDLLWTSLLFLGSTYFISQTVIFLWDRQVNGAHVVYKVPLPSSNVICQVIWSKNEIHPINCASSLLQDTCDESNQINKVFDPEYKTVIRLNGNDGIMRYYYYSSISNNL